MASTFHLEIATPERLFMNEEVEMVVVTTPEGKMGIMKGHLPMIVAISSNFISIKMNGETKLASIASGFMEITSEKVIILVDSAEWPEEIDINRALEAKKRAEERLHFKLSEKEYVQSEAALARALARLKVTRKFK